MTILDILALLLGMAAVFGFINHKLLRLPRPIGLVVMALLASGGVIIVDIYLPDLGIGETARAFMRGIDFHDLLLEGMLSGLLFAGAVHVDFSRLKGARAAVAMLATLGVLINTVLVASAFWLTALILDYPLPFVWALVFGALIAPTDPVAVLGMLKTVRVPPSLETKIVGESLFNDGVAVVVFTILVAFATGAGHAAGDIGAIRVVGLFLSEALGGAALGFGFGFVALLLMRWIDDHNVEVLITLALVTGTYAAALRFGMSGPIAVVVAGLMIGNQARRLAMSETTRERVFSFWELVDEILISILFLLIGLEVLVIGFDTAHATLVLLAIPIAIVARWTSVAIPIGLLRAHQKFTRGAVRLLTWGGLRGGISVALALSLPFTEFKEPILSATYVVVIFSIIVQGLTMVPLARKLVREEEAADMHGDAGRPAPVVMAPEPEPAEAHVAEPEADEPPPLATAEAEPAADNGEDDRPARSIADPAVEAPSEPAAPSGSDDEGPPSVIRLGGASASEEPAGENGEQREPAGGGPSSPLADRGDDTDRLEMPGTEEPSTGDEVATRALGGAFGPAPVPAGLDDAGREMDVAASEDEVEDGDEEKDEVGDKDRGPEKA